MSLLLALFFGFVGGARAEVVYSEDFESYDLGTELLDIGWYSDQCSGENCGNTSVVRKLSGDNKFLRQNDLSPTPVPYSRILDLGSDLSSGILSFKGVDTSNKSGINFGLYEKVSGSECFIAQNTYWLGKGKLGLYNGNSFTEISSYTENTMFEVDLEFQVSGEDMICRARKDEGAWTDWVQTDITGTSFFTSLYLYSSHGSFYFYLDDIVLTTPDVVPEVEITSPESEATIYDLEDLLEFDFSNLLENTERIGLYFIGSDGIIEGSYNFPVYSLSGSNSQSFAEFGIERNGVYEVVASGFLSPVGVGAMYDILVNPEFSITIDVDGLLEHFAMPDFSDWYSEHSQFDNPTPIFSGITSLLAPFFERVSDFGLRSLEFFDEDSAYNRGQSLGVIPIRIKVYIDAFSVFIGGFPLYETFAFLIVLIAVFFLYKLVKGLLPIGK